MCGSPMKKGGRWSSLTTEIWASKFVTTKNINLFYFVSGARFLLESQRLLGTNLLRRQFRFNRFGHRPAHLDIQLPARDKLLCMESRFPPGITSPNLLSSYWSGSPLRRHGRRTSPHRRRPTTNGHHHKRKRVNQLRLLVENPPFRLARHAGHRFRRRPSILHAFARRSRSHQRCYRFTM